MIEITHKPLQPWSRMYTITLSCHWKLGHWNGVEKAVACIKGLGCVLCGPDGAHPNQLHLKVATCGSWDKVEQSITETIKRELCHD